MSFALIFVEGIKKERWGLPHFGKGLAAKPAFRKIGGGGMIRHRLLCLGYFDFGSVGLFNLGFLFLFAAYAQQSQNAAADVQSSQPTDVVAVVTGLRTLGGVVISWLNGVIITAAYIAGVAAVGELVDDRILAALGAANGAFLVLDAGGLLGSGLVDHPLEAVCCRVGLVAALALVPVVGAVILPLGAVAVGMTAACCGDRCGFKNLLADGAFLMLSAVGGFGSCRVNDPVACAVCCCVGLIAALALVPVTEEKSRFFQKFLPFGCKKPLDRTAKGFSFAYSSFKVTTMSLFSMAVATSASLLSKPLFSTISSRFQRTPFLEMPSLSAIS